MGFDDTVKYMIIYPFGIIFLGCCVMKIYEVIYGIYYFRKYGVKKVYNNDSQDGNYD